MILVLVSFRGRSNYLEKENLILGDGYNEKPVVGSVISEEYKYQNKDSLGVSVCGDST